MNANRYFSIAYDARNDVMVRLLRARQGGIVAFGRFIALLSMLYDQDGRLDFNDEAVRLVTAAELELDEEGLDSFIADCLKVGLLSQEAWDRWGVVMSEGVIKEIDYHRQRKETGKMGGRPKGSKSKPKEENVDL